MPSTKISALPAATNLNGGDVFPIVQSGSNKKASINLLNVQTVTYSQLQTLISGNNLIIGQLYKITGFNKNMPSGGPDNPDGYLPVVLYDDGTNSGITIYMTAITGNQLSTDGWGEFYNPKYIDGNSYYNTDGTGLYGIWDGDNPDPLQVPAYTVGQVVFWGGYAWQNVSGNVGNALDLLTLSADWTKLPYSNTTYYEMVIDEIKVDWLNGILVERYNAANQIRVAFNAPEYYWWMGIYSSSIQCNPISVMGWGLYSKVTQGVDGDYYGITNVESINSLCEAVNFKGSAFFNNYLNDSYLFSNYFGIDTYFIFYQSSEYGFLSNNYFRNGSIFEVNTNNDGRIRGNTFIQVNSYNNRINRGLIDFNNFDQTSLSYNKINNNSEIISNNTSVNSQIAYNTLDSSSKINSNTLDNGNIILNTLSQNSRIRLNSLTASSIQNNDLSVECKIEINVLDTSTIYLNKLSQNSIITENNLTASSIQNNDLSVECTILKNTLNVNSQIKYNTIQNFSGIETNNLQNISTIEKNHFSVECYISGNGLDAISSIRLNILDNNSNILNNGLQNNSSYIEKNELSAQSQISENVLDTSSIYLNKLKSYSTIYLNTLQFSVCEIYRNIMDASEINQNTLQDNGRILNNEMHASRINENNVTTSGEITLNSMTSSQLNTSGFGTALFKNNRMESSNILGIVLLQGDECSYNTFKYSFFNYYLFGNGASSILFQHNQLFNSSWDGSVMTGNLPDNIVCTVCNCANVNVDLLSATHIYYATEKKIYQRLDGNTRLTWYDNNDTPLHSTVDA